MIYFTSDLHLGHQNALRLCHRPCLLYTSRYYQTLTIGASGVVYGFFGAIIALGLILGGPFMSLLESSIYIIVINLIYTFVDRNISKTGHIGGLIGGILAIVMILALHIA